MTKRQGYRVRVGEREHEVEVELGPQGERRILVDGEAFEVADAGGRALRVSATDAEHSTQLELSVAGSPRPTEAWVGASGTRVAVELRTEQEARLAAALGKGSAGSSSGELKAPMPGRVVKVLVSEGEQVAQGSPVIIVEAMKMENELQAPVAGPVRQILVGEGDTVDAGQVLVVLEPPAED